MFADLRKSTSLIGILGPMHFHWLIGRLFSLVRSAVLDQHGVVEKFLGDGALAVFTKPGDVPGDQFPTEDPPVARAARAAFEIAAGFERLIGELEAHLVAQGAADRYPQPDYLALGVSLVREEMVFGTIGPLVGRQGGSDRLPFEFSAIGVAAGRAQRICEYAKHEVLKLAHLACQFRSDVPVSDAYPGARLATDEGERRAFARDGWDRYAYRTHPHVIVLVDISVVVRGNLAEDLGAYFVATDVPVWWELRGFGCSGRFSVLTPAVLGREEALRL